MSSKRFEIDVGLNASGVAKGAGDGKKALADLEAAVGDVADESARSGRKVDSFAAKLVDASRKAGKSDDDIKDALRGMGLSAKQAEEAVEDIGSEFKETGREGRRSLDDLEDSLRDVQRQSKRTEDSVDDIGGQGFGKLKEGAQEVTQEVGQNLGEAVSSIRGDLTDLGQVGQDTLGGLAATLASTGPAGIAGAAALAAGAVGLGLVTAEIDKQNERVQALKQYFADAWAEAVEGGKNYIDLATIIGEMQDIQFNPERVDELKRIQEDAKSLSLDTSTLLRAAAGDEEALNQVRDRSLALLDKQEQKIRDTQENLTAGQEAQLDALHQQEDAIRSVNDRWSEYGAINDENKQKAADAKQATTDYLLSLVSDASSATEEVDKLGNKLITLPDGRQVLIEAKTGQATADVDKFEGDVDETIRKLNAKDITLAVKAAVQQAQNEVNRFVERNNGRTIRLHGRFDIDNGTDWD